LLVVQMIDGGELDENKVVDVVKQTAAAIVVG
jgi:hypothetical protein